MISHELLRQFPYFKFMNYAKLNSIATISNEIIFEGGETLLEAGESADYLYIVVDGRLALYDVLKNDRKRNGYDEYFVAYIEPGELAGISAVIPPHIYGETVRAKDISRVIQLRSIPLLAYCDTDFEFTRMLYAKSAHAVMKQMDNTCKAWVRGMHQVRSL